MKKLVTFFALVLLALTAEAQIVNIPDADFKAKLLAANASNSIALNGLVPIQIDTNNNSQIEVTEALQVTSLNVSIANIHDLTGIASFTNLRTLNCNQNHIPVLDVSALVNLKSLYCSLNLLTALDLTGLTQLTTLECAENVLTQINFANANGIRNLSCRFNFLTALNLSSLNTLQTLNFDYNQLTTINLSNLTQLTDLGCQSNQLTTIDLSALVNLVSLNCSYNQLTALNLTGLNALSTLNCSHNQITHLDLLALDLLVLLNCEFNQISNPLVMTGMADLQSVYCHHNLIPSFSFTEVPSLAVLDCSFNQMTAFDGSGIPSLGLLNCHDNAALVDLNIKNGTNEPFLDFSNNPNLLTMCADGGQLSIVQDLLTQYGYTNCQLSSTCDLGLVSNASASSLTLYPNPVKNSLQVVLNGIQKINSIALYNTLGQQITLIPVDETAAAIDLSHFKTGTYFIKVTTDNGSTTAAVLKD